MSFFPILVALFLSFLQVQATPLLGLGNTCPPVTITQSPVTVTIPGNIIPTTVTDTVSVTTGSTTIFLPQTNTAVAKRGEHKYTNHKPTKYKHTPTPKSYHTKATPTTCTDGITITLPAITATVTAPDTTSTATTTVTVSVLATATNTASTFKVIVHAPTNAQYDGDYLFAGDNTPTQGAFPVRNYLPGTILAVDTQGRLIVDDPTNNFNGYIANASPDSRGFYTVLLDPAPTSHVLSCEFVADVLTCTDPDSGDSVFEACGGYLRISTELDGGDCALATLQTVETSSPDP